MYAQVGHSGASETKDQVAADLVTDKLQDVSTGSVDVGSGDVTTRVPSIEDFEFIKAISKGAFGNVYLGRKKNKADRVFAIKMMKKEVVANKNLIHQVETERDALAKSHSPFITQLYYSFQDKEHIYLVMEYLIGGDVKSLLFVLGFFEEAMSVFYAAHVVLALQYLHNHGIIHRDIKPDNMLIDAHGHLKLTDFGLSKITLDISHRKSAGAWAEALTPMQGCLSSHYYRTPGMILSLQQPLAFSTTPVRVPKDGRASSSDCEAPPPQALRTPLGSLDPNVCPKTPLSAVKERSRLVNQSSPPIKSLTPTLQDSLTWKSSGTDASPPVPDHVQKLGTELQRGMSESAEMGSMFESSISVLGTSQESIPRHFSQQMEVSQGNESMGFPSSDEGMQWECSSHDDLHYNPDFVEDDDTPHLHRTTEAVCNSYAATKMRSMREGSYSESKDDSSCKDPKAAVSRPWPRRKHPMEKSSSVPTGLGSHSALEGIITSTGSSSSSNFGSFLGGLEKPSRTRSPRRQSRISMRKKRSFEVMVSDSDTSSQSSSGLTQEISVMCLDHDTHQGQRKRSNTQAYMGEPADLGIAKLGDPEGQESRRLLQSVTSQADIHYEGALGPGSPPLLSPIVAGNLPLPPFRSSPRPLRPPTHSCLSGRKGVHSSPVPQRHAHFDENTQFPDLAFHLCSSLDTKSVVPMDSVTVGADSLKTPLRSNLVVQFNFDKSPIPHTPYLGLATPLRTPKNVRRGALPKAEEERILGTPDYLAPEILNQQPHGAAVDWWAFGVCLYEFLTGLPPFNDETPEKIFRNILARDITWPEGEEKLSREAQDAVEQLLTLDPDQRPDAQVVRGMVLFQGIDWNHVLGMEPQFVPHPDSEQDTSYFDGRNMVQNLVVSDIKDVAWCKD